MKIGILDSENIQTVSSDMLKEISKLIICVGPAAKQFKLTLPCLESEVSIKFIHCSGQGRNNIDSHIISLIGFYFSKSSISSITVISNDSGFKNIIKFWRNKGYSIFQVGSQQTKYTQSTHELNYS